MNMFVLALLYIMFGILWAGCSYLVAFTHPIIGKMTGDEFDKTNYKRLYLIKLAFEGPFIFLRLLKK